MQRDFSYDSLSDVFGGWKIFKTQYTGLDYQVIGNIAMFFPFGLLWALTFEREEKSAKTLLITLLSSLCFSAFIEITQLIFSKGTFQFSDIVYNTLGGVLGAIIFIIINLIIKKANIRPGTNVKISVRSISLNIISIANTSLFI